MIYKGSQKQGTIYKGSTKIGKIYKGGTLVYQSKPLYYCYYSDLSSQYIYFTEEVTTIKSYPTFAASSDGRTRATSSSQLSSSGNLTPNEIITNGFIIYIGGFGSNLYCYHHPEWDLFN